MTEKIRRDITQPHHKLFRQNKSGISDHLNIKIPLLHSPVFIRSHGKRAVQILQTSHRPKLLPAPVHKIRAGNPDPASKRRRLEPEGQDRSSGGGAGWDADLFPGLGDADPPLQPGPEQRHEQNPTGTARHLRLGGTQVYTYDQTGQGSHFRIYDR